MKTYQTSTFLPEEREVHLNYDPISETWSMDCSIPKYFNKAIKQGWTPIAQWVNEAGSVQAMQLEAPSWCVGIKNVKKREMPEEQREAARARLMAARESKQ